MEIPKNQTVMPYLIIQNASRFILFTQKVFDAKETHKAMRDGDTIMHGEMMIGECIIMFADATDKYKTGPAGLFIYVDNADETFKKAMVAGASTITKLSDQPYGGSGGIADPFGNTRWITSVIKG